MNCQIKYEQNVSSPQQICVSSIQSPPDLAGEISS